jgi:hypothetical protein
VGSHATITGVKYGGRGWSGFASRGGCGAGPAPPHVRRARRQDEPLLPVGGERPHDLLAGSGGTRRPKSMPYGWMLVTHPPAALTRACVVPGCCCFASPSGSRPSTTVVLAHRPVRAPRQTKGRFRHGRLAELSELRESMPSTWWELQARDELGHDLRSGLSLLGERDALSGPQR